MRVPFKWLFETKGKTFLAPSFNFHSLDNIEAFASFDEGVRTHSNGELTAIKVMRKYCCASCLYVITEGRKGIVPPTSIELFQM